MAERDLIENIRVLAWFHSVAMEAECKPTAYALEQRFDELRMERVPDSEQWPAVQFQRYTNGDVTPTDETLDRVERVLPTTKETFMSGPKSESGVASLWLAMAGPLDAVRAVLNGSPTLWALQLKGVDFLQLMLAVTDRLFPREIFEYLPTWEHNVMRNPVRHAIDAGYAKIRMDDFVLLTALFRLSAETGAAFPAMDLVMTGILHKAVYDLFDEWGISRQVKVYLEIIRDLQRDAMARGRAAFEEMQASRAAKH